MKSVFEEHADIDWSELREIYFAIDMVRRFNRGEYTVAYTFEFSGTEINSWVARVIDGIWRIQARKQ